VTAHPARADDLRVTLRGAWLDGRRMACSVGRAGIGEKRGEGDGVTPIGVWRLTGHLRRADRFGNIETQLPSRLIGPADGWSDDPKDPAYNRPCPWPGRLSAERLRRADRLYDLIATTNFNADPVRAGAGSAIFVHVRRGPSRPTEGCIAFDVADLTWILRRWRPWRRLVVQP